MTSRRSISILAVEDRWFPASSSLKQSTLLNFEDTGERKCLWEQRQRHQFALFVTIFFLLTTAISTTTSSPPPPMSLTSLMPQTLACFLLLCYLEMGSVSFLQNGIVSYSLLKPSIRPLRSPLAISPSSWRTSFLSPRYASLSYLFCTLFGIPWILCFLCLIN